MKEVAVSRAELLRLLEASGAKASENEDILAGQCWLSLDGKSYILEGSAEAVSAGLGRTVTKSAPTTPSRAPAPAPAAPPKAPAALPAGESLVREAKGLPAKPESLSLIDECKGDFPGAA